MIISENLRSRRRPRGRAGVSQDRVSISVVAQCRSEVLRTLYISNE